MNIFQIMLHLKNKFTVKGKQKYLKLLFNSFIKRLPN